MPKLTKRYVEGLTTRDKEYIEWDSALPGFGIRMWPTGRKVYIVQYRTREGVSRRKTLGRHGVVTAEQARDAAQQLLAQVGLGRDPMAEVRAARQSPTVAEFAQRYLQEHVRIKKKPNSIRNTEQHFRCHILPVLGSKKLNAVTRADIAALHVTLRHTPSAANHVLVALSHLFTMATQWGVLPEGINPARRIERYRENHPERFLSYGELSRLGDVLLEAERTQTVSPAAIAAIRLLILTGARRSEIIELRWEYIDIERSCLRLPDSKTGSKVIQLSTPALNIVTTIPRVSGNPYVLVGRKSESYYQGLTRAWYQIRTKAGLDDVRLHDLRHSFASVGVGLGVSIPIIGKLLGHTQGATTERYAHLAVDPVRAATDKIGAVIAEALSGER